MKKILNLIILVFILNYSYRLFFPKDSLGENILKYEVIERSEIAVPWQLSNAIDDFMIDAEKYGVSKNRLFSLDKIYIYKDNDETYGETEMWIEKGFLHGQINIRESILDDSVGLKWVVYHELGHWYGLDHSEGIMEDGYTTSISPHITPYYFDLLAWEFFTKIRDLHNLPPIDYKGIEK